VVEAEILSRIKRRIFARPSAMLKRRRGTICSSGRQTAEVSCVRFDLAARPACAHSQMNTAGVRGSLSLTVSRAYVLLSR
jgi:hypothetical protein